MSEKLTSKSTIQTRETVYFVDQLNGEPFVRQASALRRNGSRVQVSYQTGGGATISTSKHGSEIFTPLDVASIAADLMPTGDHSEEKLLDKAVEDYLESDKKDHELTARLIGAAVAEFATKTRTPEDLGIVQVESIIGDEALSGSNLWRIRELITGYLDGIYDNRASNNIDLASPTEDITLLPDSQAAAVKEQIDALNRQALDAIYEYFGVDFAEAKVYESTRSSSNTQEQKTVYPAPSNGISFLETAFIPEGTDLKAKVLVEVVVGHPTYTIDDGYYPAI